MAEFDVWWKAVGMVQAAKLRPIDYLRLKVLCRKAWTDSEGAVCSFEDWLGETAPLRQFGTIWKPNFGVGPLADLKIGDGSEPSPQQDTIVKACRQAWVRAIQVAFQLDSTA